MLAIAEENMLDEYNEVAYGYVNDIDYDVDDDANYN
jgi:hypothetical protein